MVLFARLFLLFCSCFALRGQDAVRLPLAIAPDDARIQYIGRFDTAAANGPRFAWSGSRIVARFEGSAINVELSGRSTLYLNVLIDGQQVAVLQLAEARRTYALAKDLPAGVHTLELFQRTESAFGTGQLHGFQLPSDGRLLPPPPRADRRIEIIGDSITCGYGNEGVNAPDDSWRSDTENQYLAYGSITARALGAEAVILSASGGCLAENTKGSPVLPRLYPLLLPGDKQSKWDFRSWVPQAVVINLGTNDVGVLKKSHPGWVRDYREFLAAVRSSYPDTHFFLALGSMLYGEDLKKVRAALQDVVEQEAAAGNTRITFVEFAGQTKADGIGNGWHPSAKTHQKMADVLIPAIKQQLGW